MFSRLKNLLLLSLTFIVIPPYVLEFSDVIPGSSVADLYPVHGIDVSHYQGDIDWLKLSQTKLYSFAYIKATESHDFVDNKFKANWENAQTNNVIVGAYHFFTMRSSGISQANYFISKVPNEINSLPPAIDVEIDFHQDPQRVKNELSDMVTTLYNYYLKKPIIYANYYTYNLYLKGRFDEHEIWIRDTDTLPVLNRNWLFWQHTDKGRALGIVGFVDQNVFNGDIDQLQDLAKPDTQQGSEILETTPTPEIPQSPENPQTSEPPQIP